MSKILKSFEEHTHETLTAALNNALNWYNSIDVIRLLLKKGTNIDATSLHKAILYHASVEVLKTLMQAGADVTNQEEMQHLLGLAMNISDENRRMKILNLLRRGVPELSKRMPYQY
ncbi:MAG: hypothetical protein KR126chlam1_00915 [Chlamydiae bacterium]|nr:hypothetical protein [Chlamydiota bacterium]